MPQTSVTQSSLLPGDVVADDAATHGNDSLVRSAAAQLGQAYLACRQELLRYVHGHVRCPEMSSDIAQETFVKALATPPGSIREPRAFLFRTARNLSIDYLRHQKIRAEAEDGTTEIEKLASHSPPAEAALHARRQMDILKAALADLPQKRREIFMLHRFDGASHAELAAMYGLSRNMIEKHVIAAVAHCRKRLQEWESGQALENSGEKA